MNSIMPTFLERYLNGQHVEVWNDLIALGDEVRKEPVFTDAQAVADETMRRARRNLEILIPRLYETARHHDDAVPIGDGQGAGLNDGFLAKSLLRVPCGGMDLR